MVISTKLNYLLGINFGICLLLFLATGIFFGTTFDTSAVQYIIISLMLVFKIEDKLKRALFSVVSLSILLFCMLTTYSAFTLFIAELFLIGIAYSFVHKDIPFFIIGISFLLHLFYIQNTDVNIRQHDLSGIFTYMIKITQDDISHFNPWNMYYLFHQPLHFIINGILYNQTIALWGSTILAEENLQFVSLFYVTGISIFSYALLRLLDVSKISSYAALILISFNPTLILFSGYISDDTPVLFWITFTTYYSLRWYKENKFSDIVIAAIGFGLGTLTKLSILMIVPALCFLFLCKLAKAPRNKAIWTDIFTFIIIAVPLSLAWIFRNHILYDMQFFNIPDTSPAGQNFKNLSLLYRLTDFSQISLPFINAPHIADSNILLALIKTELFGEWDLSIFHKIIFYPSVILYILNILIKVFVFGSLVGLLVTVFKHPKRCSVFLCFLALQYLIIWGYSLNYAMQYPYICSTDYRLFAQLILAEGLILALLNKKETGEKIFLSVSLIYSALVLFIYSNIY